MSGPQHRIRLIEGSLRCFALGVLSLVPLLGLPAAMLAWQEHARTRRQAGDEWNAAHRYLVLGYLLSWFGLAATGAFGTLLGTSLARWIVERYF